MKEHSRKSLARDLLMLKEFDYLNRFPEDLFANY